MNVFDSHELFKDENTRFQYYQRVFTHQSVNKYLVIKNVNNPKTLINPAAMDDYVQDSFFENINNNHFSSVLPPPGNDSYNKSNKSNFLTSSFYN